MLLSYNNTINICSLENYEVLDSLTLTDSSEDIIIPTFCSGDSVIVACSSDSEIYIFEHEKGLVSRFLAFHNYPASCSFFNQSSKSFMIAYTDGLVCHFDLETTLLKYRHTFQHKQPTSFISLSGAMLGIFFNNGMFSFYNAEKSKQTDKYFNLHTSGILSAFYDNNLGLMLTSGKDSTVAVWKIDFSRHVVQLVKRIAHTSLFVSFKKIAVNQIALLSAEGHLFTSDLNLNTFSNTPLYKDCPSQEITQAEIMDDTCRYIGLLADGNMVIADDKCPEKIEYLLCSLGHIISSLALPGYKDPTKVSIALANSTNDIFILPDISSHRALKLSNHTLPVLCLAYSPEKKILASGSKDTDISIWSSNRHLFKITGHTSSVTSLAFSHHGNGLITSSSDLTIKSWTLHENCTYSANWTTKAHEKDINRVIVNQTLKIIVSASQDKTIKVWNLEDGTNIATLSGHKRSVWDVKISPDNDLLISASADKTIRVWSLKDYECLRTYEGHCGSILSCVFVDNGRFVANSTSDGIVTFLDLRDKLKSGTLVAHDDKIWTLECVEGKLLTTGEDGRIKLWENCDEKLLKAERSNTEKEILQDQKMSNFLEARNFTEAIKLAFESNKFRKVYDIFCSYLQSGLGKDKLPHIESHLRETLISSNISDKSNNEMLRALSELNVTTKLAVPFAQLLLNPILVEYFLDSSKLSHADTLLLDSIKKNSEAHIQRVENMMVDSALIDLLIRQYQ